MNAGALSPVQSLKNKKIKKTPDPDFFRVLPDVWRIPGDSSSQECGQEENADPVLFRLNHLSSGCRSGEGVGGDGSDVWVHCMELAKAKQSDFQR